MKNISKKESFLYRAKKAGLKIENNKVIIDLQKPSLIEAFAISDEEKQYIEFR